MKIAHTMIRVGDLDRSLAFYSEVLGMKLTRRSEHPEGRFTLAFLAFAGDSAEIELTFNWDTATYEMGNAFGHIALAVDDVYATCAAIKAKGGKVVREAGPMKGGKAIIAFIEDPDGYKIELTESN